MLVNTINHELIEINNPRRYDSTCICKVKYDGGKLDVNLENVRLLNVKKPDAHDMYVNLRLDRETVKHVLRMEKAIVSIVAQNTDEWFKSKMKSCAVDEHFSSSIVLDEENNAVFKCRLE